MEEFLRISELLTTGLGLVLATRILYLKNRSNIDPTVWEVFVIAILLS